MKYKRLKILTLLLLTMHQFVPCLGQTGAHFSIAGLLYKADQNDNLQALNKKIIDYCYSAISNQQGDLLLNFNNSQILVHKDSVVNGKGLYNYTYSNLSDTFNGAYNAIFFIKVSSDKYRLVLPVREKSGPNFSKGVMYSEIEFDSTVMKWKITLKNQWLRQGAPGQLAFNRNPDGSHNIVFRVDDYIYLYQSNKSGISFRDSMFMKRNAYYPDTLFYNPQYKNKYTPCSMVNNSVGDKYYLADEIWSTHLFLTGVGYYRINFFEISINKLSNKFSSCKLFDSLYSREIDLLQLKANYRNSKLVLTPNDSFLFFPATEFTNDTSVKPLPFKSKVLIYNTDNYNRRIISTDRRLSFGLKLLPSGNIMAINLDYRHDGSGKEYYNASTYIFKTPNNNINHDKNLSLDSFKIDYDNPSLNLGSVEDAPLISFNLFDYVRTNPKITYGCSATVEFENKTNISNGINEYTWVICRDSNCLQKDTIKNNSPKIIFKENGKYPYAVYGYSPRSYGYGEWYFDTININIPPKPSAHFTASKNAVCRFEKIDFTDSSITADTNIANGISWRWSLDTEKDTMIKGNSGNIHFEFSEPGYKQVQLIYSNGYCQDTSNVSISVKDGPKPGFSIDKQIGCQPLKITIVDTVTLNLTDKEYYFSNSNTWKSVGSGSITFSETFTDTGNFFIVQKLNGINGCVIIHDTARIRIRPGIRPGEMTQVYVASYINNENIEIKWSSHSAAVNYQIQQSDDGINYQILNILKDTFFVHNIQNPQLIYYRVFATDSCSNITGFKNHAKPILLKVSMKGANESALLNFTGYEDWANFSSQYMIYKFDTLGNQISVFQKSTLEHEDESLSDDDVPGACYQIRALSSDSKYETRSNTSCVKLLPVMYIPNAFTPNKNDRNEVFKPVTRGISSYNFQIYDRWGELIATFDENSYWDGLNRPDGIYFYIYKATATNKKVLNGSGSLTVIR